jgi:hypothetical protein
MSQPGPTRAEAIAERDEAIAERGVILNFVQDLGDALSKGRLTGFHPTCDGIEIRSLYASQADAAAAAARIHGRTGMAALAGEAVQHTVH